MKTKKKCTHPSTEIFEVEFKNGTKHYRSQCAVCGRYLGFISRGEIDKKASYPKGKTTKQIREEQGLPNGCFLCGSSQSQIVGLCKSCKSDETGKLFIKEYRKISKSPWRLNKEQIETVMGKVTEKLIAGVTK